MESLNQRNNFYSEMMGIALPITLQELLKKILYYHLSSNAK